MIKNPLKIFWIILGFLALGLGIVGIFIPVLPSVPFLLLTFYCFARGSTRLKKWFTSTKIYKDNLEPFATDKKMTLMGKIRIIILITLVMGFGFFMMSKFIIAQIILAIIWALHIIYFIFLIKSTDRVDDVKDEYSK